MASEELKNFSNELKEQREKTGITLQQISQSTKIDLKFLRSIEDGNFDILPEIYVKAFIKEYAGCINLNPNETIKKYEKAKVGLETKKLNADVFEETKNESTTAENESKPTKIESDIIDSNKIDSPKVGINNNKFQFSIKINYVIGTLILLSALSILYYSIIYTPEKEIITVNNQSENKSTERFEVEKQNSSNQGNDIQNFYKDDSLKLLIQTNADVWVKVIKDGKNVHQKVTPKDSKLQFKAKDKFSVSVGNAGVVKIFYNDNEIKNLGKYGEIRNVTITPDTIKFLTIKRNDKKSN